MTNFGALEIQAVYISGNVRQPFDRFMAAPSAESEMDWSAERNYPRPDFLSSSLKRLVPQLLFKGAIFSSWGKKIAVAMNESFFSTLPAMEEVTEDQAAIAWMLYEAQPVPDGAAQPERYDLRRMRQVYTKFAPALTSLTTASPGPVEDFVNVLQAKLDEKLETEPINRILGEI